jgi:hypothetical protein
VDFGLLLSVTIVRLFVFIVLSSQLARFWSQTLEKARELWCFATLWVHADLFITSYQSEAQILSITMEPFQLTRDNGFFSES